MRRPACQCGCAQFNNDTHGYMIGLQENKCKILSVYTMPLPLLVWVSWNSREMMQNVYS